MTDNTLLTTALAETHFAAEFSEDFVHRLAADAKWKHCPAGTVLFREGNQCDAFYLVHRGHLALEMCLPARGCTRIITLGPGEVVAWSALVGNGRMTATAIATEDVELIEFSAAKILQISDEDLRFGYVLMRRMATSLANRLLATRLQMLDLFKANATSSDRDNP
jgi:CRP/FNR family cyclic AMP-dependent transcriptional regulator